MGLGYLTLDRAHPPSAAARRSASAWRRSWAATRGVCYVLDEPTIGLHARDNQILLNALRKLGDKGNTPGGGGARRGHHPPADHIIDIGPSAGKRGGNLVAQGSVADISGRGPIP